MTNQQTVSQTEFHALLNVLNHPEHRDKIGERTLTITRIEHPAKQLTRIHATISGEDPLNEWDAPNPTIRITIPEPAEGFAEFAEAPQTTSRVYTLTDINTTDRSTQIELVRHAEQSPAMRWLNTLAVGDTVQIIGPRPHRTPGPGTPRILLADSSALPAAIRILQTTPQTTPTLLIAATPEDEYKLAQKRLHKHKNTIETRRIEPTGKTALATAFAGLNLPDTASVWASGERDDIRQIRHRCKHELKLAPEQIQVFGYWKKGVTNTRIDIARLRAGQKILAEGRKLAELDDFEIEL